MSAVIDWGFLSLFGDSSLEASGIYNLYGDHHRKIDDFMLSTCVDAMGYDRHRLLVYRALYAIMTSKSYSEDGSDGQYAWCVNTLHRDDIRGALSHIPE